MAVRSQQEEALRVLIRHCAIEAFETEETLRIAVCTLPYCVPVEGGCPVCEIVVCLPNGVVVREDRRGH